MFHIEYFLMHKEQKCWLRFCLKGITLLMFTFLHILLPKLWKLSINMRTRLRILLLIWSDIFVHVTKSPFCEERAFKIDIVLWFKLLRIL